ncbi:unnamed protein product [Calypogeia fissa]
MHSFGACNVQVENQIPLIPIRNVLAILMERVGGHVDQLVGEIMHKMCSKVVTTFSSPLPGYDPRHPDAATKGVSFVECHNFLDCVYTTLTHKLRGRMKQSKVAEFTDAILGLLPSVTELRKAGIEFRGCKGFGDIEFKARFLKGTLYLPTLHIYDNTESLWRNLVAHEQQLNDGADFGSHPDFINYIDFMDSLIDSENDVMVLRSGKYPTIAYNSLGTDAAVANLFNTLLQYTILIPSKKWSKLRCEIYDFYNKGQRQMYLEFKEAYFGKPWLTISVVAATIALIMTILTAAYTMALYYHP